MINGSIKYEDPDSHVREDKENDNSGILSQV